MTGLARRAVSVAVLVAALRSAEAGKPAAAPGVAAPLRSEAGNGMTLLLLPRRGLPLVQMQLMLPVGSRHDAPGREGTARLVAQLLPKGTTRRNADRFADDVEYLGGTLAAQAGLERTVIAGEFAARDLETGLGLLAEMVREPAFDAADVARERDLLLAGIEATLDDPDAIADRAFTRWLYGGHPYGRPAGGDRKSAAAITRDDLQAFHRTRYRPQGAVLILSGDFEGRRARRAVGKSFGSWKGAPPHDPPLPAPAAIAGRRILLLDKPDLTQSPIRLGNVALRRADPDWAPLRVVDTVLGGGFTSRLVTRVRVEAGLAYAVGSDVSGRSAGGSLSISTSTKNATVEKTLGLILEITTALRATGPTTEELDKARHYLAGQYPLSLEAPDDLAAAFLDAEFYGLAPDSVARYADRVRAVTPVEARAAAARFVPSSDAAIVVVGPAAELKPALESLGTVTVRPVAWAIEGGP